MTAQQDDRRKDRALSEDQLAECLRLTLRGFSKQELTKSAERACKLHFGECAWRIDEATCVPCMGTLGGRVRLYEARFVATGATEH